MTEREQHPGAPMGSTGMYQGDRRGLATDGGVHMNGTDGA